MEMKEIQKLIDDGVTLEQVSEELDYRDMAMEGSTWDDCLFEYSIEELEEVEAELIKRKS